MRPIVMSFDVLKVASILELRLVPVELTHPQMNRRVSVPYRADVALEMPDVHRVKAHLTETQIIQRGQGYVWRLGEYLQWSQTAGYQPR